MTANVSRESVRLTPLVRAQIEAVTTGYRRRIAHGGALCSHCLHNPPTHRPYCDRCRARYAQLRRLFTGDALKAAWAADACEKRLEAGYGRGEGILDEGVGR